MRKTPLIFLLFSTVLCLSQSTFSYHGGNSFGAVSIGNNLYYVEEIFDGCCFNFTSFTKSKNGQIIYRNNISSALSMSTNPVLIVPTADYHLAVVTSSGIIKGCDNITIAKPMITKIDTAGNSIWKLIINKGKITHLLGLADSSMIFVAKNILYRINALGVIKDSLAAGIGTVQSVCRYNADSFLVHHVNGAGPNIKKISNKLKAGADVLVGATNEKMQALNDGGLIALSGGRLIRYNHSLTWISSSDTQIPLTTYWIRSFVAAGDTIYTTGSGGQNVLGEIHYRTLNKKFSTLYHTKSNYNYAQPTDIALTGNKVNIVATCPGVNVQTRTFIDLIHIAKTGIISTTSDVGVVSAIATATNIGLSYPVANVDATVTVKNFGNTPVYSFFVNYFGGINSGVLWCRYSGTSKYVKHILAPGDSVKVDSIFFQTRGPGTGTTAQFCFFTTIPNDEHDVNMDNDGFCATTLVLDINEPIKAPTFRLFPNPGTREIQIESDIPLSTIEIFDLHGKVLKRIDAPETKTLSIKHDLPPSLYLVRVHSDQKTVTSKLVVE